MDTAAGTALAVVIDGMQRVFCCHRATLSGRFPPNSLAAIDECVRARAPRLEIDLRFLSDDSMLVFHDAALDAETTGVGPVDALVRASCRELRYLHDRASRLCFLEEVVDRVRGSGTFLQVDLKLRPPISRERVQRLAEALMPLAGRCFVGSQAHGNLRAIAESGVPVAFDPSLRWHYWPGRPATSCIPARLGLHGLWDDSPLAQIPGTTARDYCEARLRDLLGLAPAAVEWMVDIGTLRHLASLGFPLGLELAQHGIALSAWTMRDDGPQSSRETLRALFALGAETVITDHPPSLAACASALAHESD